MDFLDRRINNYLDAWIGPRGMQFICNRLSHLSSWFFFECLNRLNFAEHTTIVSFKEQSLFLAGLRAVVDVSSFML